MSFRTIVLTERRPRTCRLGPVDVQYLLVHHRSHLDLVPTDQRHVYRVTPLGHVGIIVTPRCRLVIQPKIPLQNLFLLLDPALPLPAVSDCGTATEGNDVFDFLASQFAHQFARQTAAGLHRDYAQRAEQGPFLHGCLDVPAQLRENPTRKELLHSRYQDFTADVTCNQVLKTIAEAVLNSGLAGAEVCALLRQTLSSFDGVQTMAIDSRVFDRLGFERLPEGYRPLLDLCRLLAEGLCPNGSSGARPAPAFLINLERAFERHLTRGVVTAFAGRQHWTVAVQLYRIANQAAAGQPDLAMRPDLILEHDGQPLLVVDAKWKRLPPDSLVTEDVYQVLAYATALGASSAVLVYPGGRERVWDYALTDSPIRLVVRTLSVSGTRQQCERSLQRLGRWLWQVVQPSTQR
jgi:5-methylcytosine-specific restriction enzyme subunit McrC